MDLMLWAALLLLVLGGAGVAFARSRRLVGAALVGVAVALVGFLVAYG